MYRGQGWTVVWCQGGGTAVAAGRPAPQWGPLAPVQYVRAGQMRPAAAHAGHAAVQQAALGVHTAAPAAEAEAAVQVPGSLPLATTVPVAVAALVVSELPAAAAAAASAAAAAAAAAAAMAEVVSAGLHCPASNCSQWSTHWDRRCPQHKGVGISVRTRSAHLTIRYGPGSAAQMRSTHCCVCRMMHRRPPHPPCRRSRC